MYLFKSQYTQAASLLGTHCVCKTFFFFFKVEIPPTPAVINIFTCVTFPDELTRFRYSKSSRTTRTKHLHNTNERNQ